MKAPTGILPFLYESRQLKMLGKVLWLCLVVRSLGRQASDDEFLQQIADGIGADPDGRVVEGENGADSLRTTRSKMFTRGASCRYGTASPISPESIV